MIVLMCHAWLRSLGRQRGQLLLLPALAERRLGPRFDSDTGGVNAGAAKVVQLTTSYKSRVHA